ncbi:hypothetical protein BBO99_00008887 [Phytophthora kernoviae]|uniref:Uncharacterized protein n=2 Tax=Phytophthora kernoviae TaxID=325452 RepID=A0A3R7NAT4_9STRA|nr:hypothetical protein G195_010237 [Phytophthora kernoviae 00238/432]KAG2508789.1 hypothetical protein JM16_008705 [Phytophthora kernoviae]RLN43740.1 hypothetical protein BBI17_008897 [Phytophthora kernoviae]RLN74544.1 hypothetical protein BBO99_00008887 [Phytophthora kernoviae]
MAKWWGKTAYQTDRVTRHLSPNEIHPARSLIATLPHKTLRKIRENGPVLIPAYLRELYQILAFQKTVNWDHLKIALVSKLLHKPLGDGPFVDYEVAHDRSQL